jgi:6-pyruvoyltetrahydropterin/6-carboxytetrahydropterin synthase
MEESMNDTKVLTVWKKFTFEAAHCLPESPNGHKCRQMHGHHFTVEIAVSGEIGPEGWVIDFDQIKERFSPLLALFDHNTLNTIPGLENPTSENIALYIFNRMSGELPNLTCVKVQESDDCGVEIYL